MPLTRKKVGKLRRYYRKTKNQRGGNYSAVLRDNPLIRDIVNGQYKRVKYTLLNDTTGIVNKPVNGLKEKFIATGKWKPGLFYPKTPLIYVFDRGISFLGKKQCVQSIDSFIFQLLLEKGAIYTPKTYFLKGYWYRGIDEYTKNCPNKETIQGEMNHIIEAVQTQYRYNNRRFKKNFVNVSGAVDVDEKPLPDEDRPFYFEEITQNEPIDDKP